MKNILISTNSIIKNDEVFSSVDSNWYEYFKDYQIIPVPNNINFFKNYLSITEVSLIVLSGGGDIKLNKLSKGPFDMQRELVEEFLIEYATKKNIPLLGICRGMQKILTITNKNLEFVVNKVKIKNEYQLKGFDNNKYIPKGTRLCFNNYSIKNSSEIEKSWKILNTDQNDNVLSVLNKKNNILCLMWHPEREMSDYNFINSLIS
tara:strand:+ start:955 stop:1569 length:615 start_codon:yes stop_codon:yes gene_type:complete